MRERWLRIGLIALAVPKLAIGLWILADPAKDSAATLLGLGFEALLPLPLLWLTFRPA